MEVMRGSRNDETLDLQLDGHREALALELNALQTWLRAAGEQPEHFWQRQRARVRHGLQTAHATSNRPRWRVACSAALVLLFAATLLLNSGSAPPEPTVEVQQVADEQLLMAVQLAVQSDGPEALAPASLLIAGEKVDSSFRTGSTSSIQQGDRE